MTTFLITFFAIFFFLTLDNILCINSSLSIYDIHYNMCKYSIHCGMIVERLKYDCHMVFVGLCYDCNIIATIIK